jgi:hypothetical protein
MGKEIKSVEDFEFLLYKNFGRVNLQFEIVRSLIKADPEDN